MRSITLDIETPFDKPREECGVFGIWSDHEEAYESTHVALTALQHRGQESAGISTLRSGTISTVKGMGLVRDALPASDENENGMAPFPSAAAIGHVRYSTAGASNIVNAQPLQFTVRGETISIAHNGNIVNAPDMRRRLETDGAIFQSTSDTETIAHLLARASRADFADALQESLFQLIGGYAVVVLTQHGIIAARDPNGLRPLALGRTPGGSWCVASESCAFDAIGGKLVRDVQPGEMITISNGGFTSSYFTNERQRTSCSFEYIYFARPDSDIDGVNVHEVRRRSGELLWNTQPVEADVVIGVPDSSTSCAIGFSRASGIPFETGLVKNRYVGRTFINPSDTERANAVRLKLSTVGSVVRGKRLVLVDDSLVRGTTSKRIVKLLRDSGASEVHVRIASPPVTHSCFYGIDTSRRDQLMAASRSVGEICEFIEADSLAFLTEDQLLAAVSTNEASGCAGLCTACFNGRYPTLVPVQDFDHREVADVADVC